MHEMKACSTCDRQFHSWQGDERVVCTDCKFEKQSLALAANYKELRKRLTSARACLKIDYRRVMRNAKYQFRKRRLVSQCGQFELVWQTRSQPNLPACRLNQQTTVGKVVFNAIRRVQWTPKLN